MNFRKLKRSIYILLILPVIFTNTTFVSGATITDDQEETTQTEVSTSWPEAPSVTAESAIVMEASTGLVLYEKNSTETKYPASITKIMTTLLAVENSSLSDIVTFSNNAVFGVDLDSSRIGIDVGEELTMEDCLYGIMLASANEVSYAVAEHVGGTMENFVDMMNERATELGCVNTHFANPHGLHDPDHYTCSYDMALIAREAIKNTTFAQITGTRTYVIGPTNIQEESRPLANHHKFIKGDMSYSGVIGGKTGYTSAAKYTLVTYAKRGDMELICVVMASDSTTTEYTDTASLLDYGFDNFAIYNISSSNNNYFSEDSSLFTKYSNVFNADRTFLTTGDDGYVVLPNNVDLSAATKSITYSTIDELQEGDNVIGHITYTYLDRIVGQTDIIYKNDSISGLPTKISDLIDTANNQSSGKTSTHSKLVTFGAVIGTIVVILVFIYYILLIRARKRRRRAYLKRKKAHYRKYHNHNLYD